MCDDDVGNGGDPTNDRLDADVRSHLHDAGIEPQEVTQRRISYRLLLDAGVEESIATTLRRRFSLPWSFEADGDLNRRSDEVRGLGDAERDWVVASLDEAWQSLDPSDLDFEDRDEDEHERPWAEPTPLDGVIGLSGSNATKLENAGINSAERLATIDAAAVADAIDVDVLLVRLWRFNARKLLR